MAIDPRAIAAALEGREAVIRVVITGFQGSSPREAGAEMLVWPEGQSGTIGGGALEFEAARTAREMLVKGRASLTTKVALGPALGQCCGGAVSLAYERVDGAWLAALPETGGFARPVEAGAGEMPLPVARALRSARQGGAAPMLLRGGWLLEPITTRPRAIWLWGAGHVGRAVAQVLAPLPDVALTWIDTEASRFPEAIPEGVTVKHAADPADFVAQAPRSAEHFVLTFSHALDLELCHRILAHGHAGLGVIGSASKAARFRSRLAALGHASGVIEQMRCPIGDPSFGKHPQEIAISLASDVLSRKMMRQEKRPTDQPLRQGA